MIEKRTIWLTRFKVRGKLPFPLDMLRHDSCYPSTSADVAKIDMTLARNNRDQNGKRTEVEVELTMIIFNKGSGPTEGRWQSFSWHIVPGSIH